MKHFSKFALFWFLLLGISFSGFGQADSLAVSTTKQDTIDWKKITILEKTTTETGTISKIRNDITGNIFMYQEDMPQFPGGLLPYLAKTTRYPKDAFKKRISGTVNMSFTITATGDVTDIKIVEGVYESLDQEAVRVISLMPRWIPGKQNGTPVPVTYNLPFNFNLK